MLDYIIKNGLVIDGSGTPGIRIDIGIKKDKIVKLGSLKKDSAKNIVDASNLIVVPGFIDILNHSDVYWTLFLIPDQESLVRQGITTIICGNCGTSVTPLTDAKVLKAVQKWANIEEVNANWQDLNGLEKYLKRQKIGVNFGTLIGYSTLRRNIVGDVYRNLKEDEIQKMKLLFKKEMDEGAFGLSIGLAYSHEKFVPIEEFRQLIAVLKDYHGVLAVHLKNEGKYLLESIQELKELIKGFEKDIKIEISHFKSSYPENHFNFLLAIKMIEEMSELGIDIGFDVYPYTSVLTSAHILLPDWALNGGREMMIKRLKNREMFEGILKELKNQRINFDNFIIAMTNFNKSIVGKKLIEIAKNQNISPEEALLRLLLVSDGRVIYFDEVIAEENIELALNSKFSIVCSDGFGYSFDYSKKIGQLIHPRCFGAFPKFLSEYVLGRKIMPIEEAISKITAKPANDYKIKNRGFIKEGFFGDLVIFDDKSLASRATFTNPYQYPQGIEYVFINGEPAVEQGIYRPKMSGQVIKL